MTETSLASRLGRLSIATILGREVRVASGFRVRLLGLAHLDREVVGPGLLFPRCSSVHTFGMRFDLDLYFLDQHGAVLEFRRAVPPRRVAFCKRASAVLEISAEEGGEFSSLCP
jgi:uncharacterized membrane protein (UPF0127 family)